MDVVCGRCRAEYEFDDALISERGTTVRCTNCGLQFKVFPPVGQRAPEVWRVYDPSDRRAPPVHYESLRELQKAIVRGDVRADHLLSRGDEPPRLLSEIVELMPLLQQPRSEPSAPPPEVSEVHIPPSPPTGVPLPPGSRTVMGIHARPDPAATKVKAPPPPSTLVVDEQAIVPSHPPEPIDSHVATEGSGNRPKIRSALSITAGPRSVPPPDAAAFASPRQSLRSTLSGSLPPSSSDPGTRRPSSNPPPSRPGAWAQQPAEPEKERARSVPPPLPPAFEREIAPPTSVTAPVEPRITDSGEYPGQLTPTPSAMRAYRSPDAAPVSSYAGVPVKREARSGGLVLAVILGGGVFLGFANREKISHYLSGPEATKGAEQSASELSAHLVMRLETVELAWMSHNLLKTPESRFAGGPEAGDLAQLSSDLRAEGAASSWPMVNILRCQRKYSEARALAGTLKKGNEQGYSLALLDLAESGDSPPWPVIRDGLKQASSGERGRYLARSAYIYALAASGDVSRAQADFDALAQLSLAKDAPLFLELKAYLERLAGDEEKSADGESDEGSAADPVPPSNPEPPSSPDEPAPQPTPREDTKKPDKAPAPKDVSEAIKQKVAQADAMWRGGNQDGALAIYRQVVSEIGTAHFLGQRSAARIRQAELEKASP